MHKTSAKKRTFFGPYNIHTTFNALPGVYVIYTKNTWLDVGETCNLGDRIETHERKECWTKNALKANIYLAFLRSSSAGDRIELEKLLRNELSPACG